MDILLVLNNECATGRLKVMVKVTRKDLKQKVIALIEGSREQEAIDILKAQAEVQEYIPSGRHVSVRGAMLALYE